MNWWSRLWHGRQMDEQLDKELRFHLDQQIADLVARGVAPDEARRQAQLAFGGPTQVAEDCREARGTRWLMDMVQDLHFGLRSLRNKPGFSLAGVATLALGIGASTAIFSAVNPVLFKPLPYPNSSRIMMIAEKTNGETKRPPSFGTFRGLYDTTHSFAAMAAVENWQPTITSAAEPERLEGQNVSADYFRVLGIPPALGQDFNPADDRLHGPRVVVLSYAFWQRRFGGDKTLIGQQITLDGDKYTVIGIMPRSFANALAPSAEIWTLLQYDLSEDRAWGNHMFMTGRLRPGISKEQARHELDAALVSLEKANPNGFTAGSPPIGVLINPLQRELTESVRPVLLVIFGAVLLLLVIAGVNVTNLLLARGANRRSEFAMRSALGASRTRLLRQLLTESLLLAFFGGALGLGVAQLAVKALVALSPADLPQIDAVRVDASVLAFAVAVTTLIGLVVGLAPALQVSRNHLNARLQYGSARTTGGHQLMRRVLVVAEVAFTLVLLVSAGLLFRSVQRIFAVGPGFNAAHVLTMQVQTSGHLFDDDKYTHQFFAQALEAVRHVPGVRSAGFTSQLPLSDDLEIYGAVVDLGSRDPGRRSPALRYAVTPGYFTAMQIPLRSGRLFEEHDLTAGPPVAVISEFMEHSRFGNTNPIGRRLRLGPKETWYTIVGVVGDVKQTSLATSDADAVYIPTTQWFSADNALSLVVRAQGDAAILVPAIRKAIWSVNKDQPIVRIATMETLLASSEAQRRFALVLFECFALAALLLAAVGIYGILSGNVSERTREIGIRSALGASRSYILTLVLRQGIVLAALGVLIGLVGAFIASRALITLLFGVSPLDPLTYFGVIVMLVGVSVVACWLPAWRASRVDPSITLRAE